MGSDGSKPDFKQLSKGTKYSTKELKTFYKNFKKDFPQGKITRPQFVKLYQKTFNGEGDVTDFCDEVFSRYDTDGDGTIDFQEFMTTLSVASRGTTEEKMKWAFKLYDKDNDGYLTETEIVDILEAIYKARDQPNPTWKAAETAKEILLKADDDEDGRISLNEFIKYSSSCSAIQEMLQGF